ncbi:ATP-grasp domain-containing protein [Fusarium sp. LHS14.1]|nr:ATP-grasp domain-containing protein [Fusarium sp. LHS14.1]
MRTREWPLTVAFIYDRKVEHIAHTESPDEYSDLADDVTIGGITEALERLGHRVVHVPGLKALIKDIAANKHKNWDVVFNYSKGSHGTARESQVPAILEEYQIPFTFSDAETLAICSDKGKTKMVLSHYKVRTSPYIVVPKFDHNPLDYSEVKKLTYPLFVKPTSCSQCHGITCSNKILKPKDLEHEVDKLRSQLKDQEILIENFLGGREFTLAIAGTGESADVVGIAELVWNPHTLRRKDMIPVDFSTELARMARSRTKGFSLEDAPSSDPLWEELADLGLRAYTALGCRDGGRVDIRLTSEEQGSAPCVIEVDPIFGMRPDRSRYAFIAKSNGVEYPEMIQNFLDSAIRTYEQAERNLRF